MLTVDKGINYLQRSGAKITGSRVAILRALEGRRDHPSAEQIFLELKPDYPTLSIATVYSSAQLLARGSLLRILSIDEKKVYFDPQTDPHGHFMCRKCKRLFDVQMETDAAASFIPCEGVASVESAEVFYYGLCSKCV
jgi:Fur family peroxide stress response transcriptional regulator